MKQVLEQYAAAVITSMLALTIFILIGHGIYNRGLRLSQVLGMVVEDSIGEKAIVENGVFEEYLSGTVLHLETRNVYLIADKETYVSECFGARKGDGIEVPVYVKEVWDQNWEDVKIELSGDGRSICVHEPGAYWAQIFAEDKNAKIHSWVVKVLVNER